MTEMNMEVVSKMSKIELKEYCITFDEDEKKRFFFKVSNYKYFQKNKEIIGDKYRECRNEWQRNNRKHIKPVLNEVAKQKAKEYSCKYYISMRDDAKKYNELRKIFVEE